MRNNLSCCVLLLLFTHCSSERHLLVFTEYDEAIKSMRTTRHQTLTLFTAYTLSVRTFEKLLLSDEHIRQLMLKHNTDLLILNVDDRFQNNREKLRQLFHTDKWPVCGLIHQQGVLRSELCYMEPLQDEMRSKIVRMIKQGVNP